MQDVRYRFNSPSRNTSFRIAGNHLSLKSREYHIPQGDDTRTPKERSIARAKTTCIRKLDCSFSLLQQTHKHLIKQGWRLRFFTFTFDRDVTHNELYQEWRQFIQKHHRKCFSALCNKQGVKPRIKAHKEERERIKKEISTDYRYAAVTEKQKKNNNRLHIHAIMFTPFIKWETILSCWGNGGAYVEKIARSQRNTSNVTRYITKYITKQADDIEAHKKRFYTSRNVIDNSVTLQPTDDTAITLSGLFDTLATQKRGELSITEYDTELFGRCHIESLRLVPQDGVIHIIQDLFDVGYDGKAEQSRRDEGNLIDSICRLYPATC